MFKYEVSSQVLLDTSVTSSSEHISTDLCQKFSVSNCLKVNDILFLVFELNFQDLLKRELQCKHCISIESCKLHPLGKFLPFYFLLNKNSLRPTRPSRLLQFCVNCTLQICTLHLDYSERNVCNMAFKRFWFTRNKIFPLSLLYLQYPGSLCMTMESLCFYFNKTKTFRHLTEFQAFGQCPSFCPQTSKQYQKLFDSRK